jgi:Ala-tRNA(Pro) deacylase
MATPLWIRKMLELRGIPFQEMHHSEAYTAQDVAHAEHFSGHHVAKVVVAMADGRPIELVIPASRKVQLERVGKAVGAKDVRLASEPEIEKYFTDCEVGAVPPLRHWKNVDVLMDPSMKVDGDIVFQAGTHEEAVRLNFKDWFDLVKPQMASFSQPSDLANN